MKGQDLYHRLSPLLRPFSGPYSFFMRKRRERYTKGAGARFVPSKPCISVGNIAWGGTGKTPLVDWLLSWAKGQGLRAVVLTRGYGAPAGKEPVLVTPQTSAQAAGDEPALLARAHPEAAVLAFPARAVSGRFAEKSLRPDLFILDDGMQHLAVARHGDLVLLRPEDLGEEWGRVIPAGSWREGPLALGAATAFAMKVEAEELSRLTPAITDRLAGFGVPFFSFSLVPQLLRPLFQKGTEHGISIAPEVSSADGAAGPGTSIAPGTLLASETFRGSGYLLLSGVGGPDRVAASATAAMGKKPLFQMVFADHHPYTAQDVREAARMADRYAPDLPILCTGKDAVKLLAFEEYFQTHPVLVLEVQVAFGPALFTTEDFPQWWGRWWRENGSQPEKA